MLVLGSICFVLKATSIHTDTVRFSEEYSWIRKKVFNNMKDHTAEESG